MPAREIITVNIGRCGNQMGHTQWKQYCAEHEITSTGNLIAPKPVDPESQDDPDVFKTLYKLKSDANSFKTVFKQRSDGKYEARNLMIDTDPNVIEDIMNCEYSSIYDDESMLTGNESANNNFAKAYCRLGPEMMDKFNNKLRKQVEDCDDIEGFIVNHAVGGGTGSGLGSLVLERITDQYKGIRLGFSVFSSPTISDCVVDPYNTLLTLHRLIDHMDVCLTFDNEALYRICRENLGIKEPSFASLNHIITRTVSSTTSGIRHRYYGGMFGEWAELMAPPYHYSRLHFLVASLVPIIPNNQENIEKHDAPWHCNQCLSSNNFLTNIPDWQQVEHEWGAIELTFQGDFNREEADEAACNIATGEYENNVYVTLTDRIPSIVECNEMAHVDRSVLMIMNNFRIHRFFTERVVNKFDAMYSQKAYVHLYTEEGMEEDMFMEAKEAVNALKTLYLDRIKACEEEESEEEDSEEEDSEEEGKTGKGGNRIQDWLCCFKLLSRSVAPAESERLSKESSEVEDSADFEESSSLLRDDGLNGAD